MKIINRTLVVLLFIIIGSILFSVTSSLYIGDEFISSIARYMARSPQMNTLPSGHIEEICELARGIDLLKKTSAPWGYTIKYEENSRFLNNSYNLWEMSRRENVLWRRYVAIWVNSEECIAIIRLMGL